MSIFSSLTGITILIVSVPGHEEYAILYTNFQLVFGSIVPSLLIIVSNIGIILAVRQASRRRAKMGVEQGKEKRDRVNQLTSILIVVSAAYLITTLPLRLFYAMLKIPEVGGMYNMKVAYWNVLHNIFAHLFNDIWMCNHAVNFYLYCLAGGKGYRKDAKEMLTSLCCIKKE
jgi:hypothetical protein